MSETTSELPEPVATPPGPRPRQRSGAAALVLGGVIAAGLGYGAATLYPLAAPVAVPPQDPAIAGLEAEVADLRALVAELPLARLQDQVTALEGQISGLSAPDLSGIEQRLSVLELRPEAGLSPSEAAILTGLRAEVAALKTGGIAQSQLDAARKGLEQAVTTVKAEIAVLQAAATASAALDARRGAVLQIAAALDSGAPFGAALAVLDGNALPDALTAAAAGLPSLKSLQDSFPAAARAALDTALKSDMGQTWTDRALSFLRTQVGARSLSPRDGTDADAILSRAEAALAAGDVGAALTELSGLPDAAQVALADWRIGAEMRQSAAAALAALQAELGL